MSLPQSHSPCSEAPGTKLLPLPSSALMQKPDILIQEPLESGCPTKLTCSLPGSCKGGRPLTFSWAGVAIESLNPQTLHSLTLTFTPRPQDHGTNLTCQVKRQGSRVTTERTILLNVFCECGRNVWFPEGSGTGVWTCASMCVQEAKLT